MKLKGLAALAGVLLAVGLTTSQLDQLARGLTAAGYWGVPRYATADLPACGSTQVGALAFDTTEGNCVACDGSAWGNCFGTAITTLISAYWPLDDQFFGATANYEAKVADGSLDTTPTNNPLRAPYANRLPAAQFVDGDSEYLSVVDPWTSGDIDFSVGCWVYLDDLTGDLPIASKDDGTEQEWRLYYDDNTTDAWVFEIFDGSGGSNGSVSLTSPAPAAATWFFVVGGHDVSENEVNISVNGSAYTTAATSGAAVDTDDPFELGRMGAATYHDGRLSQCFFIKEELSAADLGDLYNNGIPVPSRQFAARVATAAEGLWDLSELSGNRSDFTANAVTLTDNNTVLHGAGLAPRAYLAADFETITTEFLSATDPWTGGDINFTISTFFKMESGVTNGTIAGRYGAGGAGNAEWLLYTPNATTVRFRIYNSGGSIACTADSGVTLVLEEWYGVSGYHDADANECGISVNGETFVTASESAAPIDTGSDFNIGDTGGTAAWDGEIGPTSIVLSVLTQAEADKFYAGGQAFSCDTIPADLPTPTLCWDLDEPSGTRSASIGDADLMDNNTVLSAAGIADIPGGVTLRAADFEDDATEHLTTSTGGLLSVADDTAYSFGIHFNQESGPGSLRIFSGAAASELFVIAGGTVQLAFESGTETYPSSGFTGLGVWYSLVVTVSADATANVEWYANGGNQHSDTATNPAIEFSVIGDPVNFSFDGLLQGATFWDGTELTAAQAALFHNSGDALACADIESVVGVAPTVCCDLDEASGTRTCDIGSVELSDINTVGSTGGIVRGNTGHAIEFVKPLSQHAILVDPDSAPLAVTDSTQSLTVTGWFYAGAHTASSYLWGKRLSGSAEGYAAYTTTTPTLVWQPANSSTTGTVTSATLSVGRWYHYALWYDAETDEAGMSINAGEVEPTPVSFAGLSDADSDFVLGRPGENAGFYSEHQQDEVVVFVGTRLSESQIACLYNSGLGRSYAELAAGTCDE